jgi:phosphotransferase system HPr (HPr) family protein
LLTPARRVGTIAGVRRSQQGDSFRFLVTEVRRTFRIINRLGLHARAASVLAKLAGGFAADISIHKDGQTARSTSVIELLLLCGQPGSDITVVAVGDDAEQAVHAIGALIQDRFGEGY